MRRAFPKLVDNLIWQDIHIVDNILEGLSYSGIVVNYQGPLYLLIEDG